MLTLSENNQIVEWSTIPNIFSKVNAMGINTALNGWYHPYGRVIGSSLTSCLSNSVEITKVTLSEAMALQYEIFIKSLPMIEYCESLEQFYAFDKLKRKYFIKSYLEILEESKKNVVDNDFGLILVHLPVPHPPGFYDRVKKDFSLNQCSYLDNLALADRTLGELRSIMESSNIWDSTTIIVTSDHWLRADTWNQNKLWVNEENVISFYKGDDHRVPFMIKLAGQKEGKNYDQAFNTIITHDLILALLTNEVSSTVDVIKWIDNNRLNWQIPDYSES